MKITNCYQSHHADRCSVTVSDADKSFIAHVTVFMIDSVRWEVKLTTTINRQKERDLGVPFDTRTEAAKFADEEVKNLLAWLIP